MYMLPPTSILNNIHKPTQLYTKPSLCAYTHTHKYPPIQSKTNHNCNHQVQLPAAATSDTGGITGDMVGRQTTHWRPAQPTDIIATEPPTTKMEAPANASSISGATAPPKPDQPASTTAANSTVGRPHDHIQPNQIGNPQPNRNPSRQKQILTTNRQNQRDQKV
ncbi:hypothetical protein Dimus_022863 [Dionaea muscipula]